jgi:glycosyltransferase involved in cell wall biosynthesis
VSTPRASGAPPGGDAVHLSVVLPSYLQATRIADNVRTALAALDQYGEGLEVIVVVDGNQDGTAAALASVDDPRLRVISYPDNMGKGYALKTGSLAARGAWIAWLDSDLDLDPAWLPGLLDQAERTHRDVVVGSKRHPDSIVDYPARRRLYSALYQGLVRVLFGLRVRDTQVGLKVFRRDVLEAVLPVTLVKRFAFDIEILAVAHRFGYRNIAEGPIRLVYRFTGSRMEWSAIARALVDTAAVFYRLQIIRYYDRRRTELERGPA